MASESTIEFLQWVESLWPNYEPLNLNQHQIRLCKLSPSDSESSFTAEIINVNISSAPAYKALSYTWGCPRLDLNPSMKLNLDQSDSSSLPAHYNLGQAMLHLSPRQGELLHIWIDAICINQKDSQEKGHQVLLMKSIYEAAEEVICWLGPPDEMTQTAFDLVEEWADFAASHELGEHSKTSLVTDATDTIPSAFDLDALTSLHGLSRWNYWTRAWILQELSANLRTRIQCGYRSITLTRLKEAIAALTAVGDCLESAHRHATVTSMVSAPTDDRSRFLYGLRHTPMARMLDMVREIRENPCKDVLSSSFMRLFSSLQATEPMDKVFAAWGFLDPEGAYAASLRPDYTLGPKMVYSRAAEYLVRTGNNLQILNHSKRPAAENLEALDLPSWVPDWSRRGMDMCWPGNESQACLVHTLKKSKQSDLAELVDFAHERSTLRLKAVQMDIITDVFGGTDNIFPYDDESHESGDTTGFDMFAQHVLPNSSLLHQYILNLYRSLGRDRNSPETQANNPPDNENWRDRLFADNSPGAMPRLNLTQLQDDEFGMINPFSDLGYICTVVHLLKTQGVLPHPPTPSSDPSLYWCARLVDSLLGGTAEENRVDALARRLLDEPASNIALFFFNYFSAKKRPILFVGSLGFLGTCCVHGPATPKPGDVVCRIAADGSTFILRPANGQYSVVRECSMRGLDELDLEEEGFKKRFGSELSWFNLV